MDPLITFLPVSACSIYALAYLVKSLLALAARVAARHHARSCRLEWPEQPRCSVAGGGAAPLPDACGSKQEASSGGAATASCVNLAAINIPCDVTAAEVVDAEPVECVFCLSDVEEGEESRELSCRHVFHRGCLDRWLAMHARATCPLCRGALATPDEATTSSSSSAAAAAAKHDGADDDADVDDWRVIVAAFLGNEWLTGCVALLSNMYSSCKLTTGMRTYHH